MSTHWSYFIITLLFLTNCQQPASLQDPLIRVIENTGSTFDLLIQNGDVFNGIDTNIFRADLLVKDDSIAFIGLVDTSKINAIMTIDANGMMVSPGFIDAHAHGNPTESPTFENFLRMGVTTICLGQDGSSPNTIDISEWMQIVDKKKPGVNIAMFLGHGTIRHLSGIGYKQEVSEIELDDMVKLLQSGMESGCFGLSMGLEYTPGIYAKENELVKLAEGVGAYDGMIMSHIRNEDDEHLQSSIEELLSLSPFCRVHIAHMKSVYGRGRKRAEEILNWLEDYPSATADVYPYNASYTGIGIVFPKWAKAPNDYKSIKKTRRKELLKFLYDKIQQRNGPEATLFGTGYFAGRTLKELSEEAGRPYEEVLLDIGPNGASGAYMVMDEALQERLFQDPKVVISSDGSPTMRHPRGYGSFAKIIEEYVLEKELMGLAEALKKMTHQTAQTIQIPMRGALREGFKADILIFDPKAVHAKATFINPKQTAEGFTWVIVNGKIAIADGELSTERFGKMLKKVQQ